MLNANETKIFDSHHVHTSMLRTPDFWFLLAYATSFSAEYILYKAFHGCFPYKTSPELVRTIPRFEGLRDDVTTLPHYHGHTRSVLLNFEKYHGGLDVEQACGKRSVSLTLCITQDFVGWWGRSGCGGAWCMMTSSNGNIFRVAGHLCGEFICPRWIPRTKASDAELWCVLWSASE